MRDGYNPLDGYNPVKIEAGGEGIKGGPLEIPGSGGGSSDLSTETV